MSAADEIYHVAMEALDNRDTVINKQKEVIEKQKEVIEMHKEHIELLKERCALLEETVRLLGGEDFLSQFAIFTTSFMEYWTLEEGVKGMDELKITKGFMSGVVSRLINKMLYMLICYQVQ